MRSIRTLTFFTRPGALIVTDDVAVPPSGIATTELSLAATAGPALPVGALNGTSTVPWSVVTARLNANRAPHSAEAASVPTNGVRLSATEPKSRLGYADVAWVSATPGLDVVRVPLTPVSVSNSAEPSGSVSEKDSPGSVTPFPFPDVSWTVAPCPSTASWALADGAIANTASSATPAPALHIRRRR